MLKLKNTPNKEVRIAYVAGVMDSDGWFTIHRSLNKEGHVNPTYSPSVGLNQSRKEAIEFFISLYGGKMGVIDFSNTTNRFSRKPLYVWKISKTKMLPFLTDIRSYLQIKGKDCELITKLRKHIDKHTIGGRQAHSSEVIAYRESLYQELRKLRGKDSPVAETKRGDSRKRDAIVRPARVENVQSSSEMKEPALLSQ